MHRSLSAALTTSLLTSALLAQGFPGEPTEPSKPIPGVDNSPTAMPAAPGDIVLPNSVAAVLGSGSNVYGVGRANQRYQQIHTGSQVGPATVFDSHYYRPGGRSDAGGVQTLNIRLSSTTVTPAAISTAMNSNVTGTQTTVFNGNLNYPGMSGSSSPSAWQIKVPYTTPFSWTGTGNLLLEIRNSSAAGLGYFPNAHGGDANVSRCYADGVNATTGKVDLAYGLCIGLSRAPTATYTLFGASCLGTGTPRPAGIVLPPNLSDEMGNSNNTFGATTANQRYQQIHAGSALAGRRTFTGHSYRMRNTTYAGGAQTLAVLFGSTTVAPAAISGTFATNVTSPLTLVFNGTFNYPNMTPNINPLSFKIEFPWIRPFHWPGTGNLLMEVRNSSATSLPYFVDAESGDASVSRVWATGSIAASGTTQTSYGLVIKLETDGGRVAVLPKSATSVMGNSNNVYGVASANQRYQQIHTGSEVGAAALISGHAYRMRNASYSGGAQSLTIRLGVTSVAPSAISATFANNITSGQTQVFSGLLNYPDMTPNTNPSSFAIPVPYTAFFSWPGSRNLLIEVFNTSASGFSYFVDAQSGDANVSRVFASGTASTTGTTDTNYGLVLALNGTRRSTGAYPELRSVGTPITGRSFDVALMSARPGRAALLVMGSSNTSWGFIPLPWHLDVIGAPGCHLRVSFDIVFGSFVVDSYGEGKLTHTIPNAPSLWGLRWHNQFVVLDTSANALGAVLTWGGTATVGGN